MNLSQGSPPARQNYTQPIRFRPRIEVAFDVMEDLSLEDLIADVIVNPTPVRVPCEPDPPPGEARVADRRGSVFGNFFRRIRWGR